MDRCEGVRGARVDVRVCGCEGEWRWVYKCQSPIHINYMIVIVLYESFAREEREGWGGGAEKKGRGIEGRERRERKRKERKEEKKERGGMEKWRRSLEEVRLNPTYMYKHILNTPTVTGLLTIEFFRNLITSTCPLLSWQPVEVFILLVDSSWAHPFPSPSSRCFVFVSIGSIHK